jgi:hypothetical protein
MPATAKTYELEGQLLEACSCNTPCPIFSTIPGSPAYVAKASHHRVNLPEFNFVWEYSGKNAIQGAFRFEA